MEEEENKTHTQKRSEIRVFPNDLRFTLLAFPAHRTAESRLNFLTLSLLIHYYGLLMKPPPKNGLVWETGYNYSF